MVPKTNEAHPGPVRDPGAPDLCDVDLVHRESVEEVLRHRTGDGDLAQLADLFQLIANPTRLRIVEALTHRELCVCDLAAVVGVSPSAVSHHLRQLRHMRIVRFRKSGRMAYYHLDDHHIAELFQLGLEHVRE